jgi:AraC-like DNA-binding protein
VLFGNLIILSRMTEFNFYNLPPRSAGVGGIDMAATVEDSKGTGIERLRRWPSYALVLSLRGAAIYRDQKGTDHPIIPGDIICVFPKIEHAYAPAPKDEWAEFFLCFSGKEFVCWHRAGLLNVQEPVLSTKQPEYWQARFRYVLGLDHPEEPLTMGESVGRLLEMIAALKKTVALFGKKGEPEWLEMAKRLLLDFRGEEVRRLPQIGKVCGLSYESFRKKFMIACGETPGAYRLRHKLAMAANLLQRTRQSIKSIALGLGFCDEFHFSKQFRQEYRMSPREYRHTTFSSPKQV